MYFNESATTPNNVPFLPKENIWGTQATSGSDSQIKTNV